MTYSEALNILCNGGKIHNPTCMEPGEYWYMSDLDVVVSNIEGRVIYTFSWPRESTTWKEVK